MRRGLFIFIITLSPFVICDAQQWLTADSLRSGFMLEGKNDSALYYANEAAAIIRGTIGEKTVQYCSMLDNLALIHFSLGNYKKAKYFILKESGLRESLKKTNDKEYVGCLQTAALICRRSGDYEEALLQVKKLDKKSTEIFKTDSPEYAEVLCSYAGVYHDMGCASNDMVYLKQEEKYLERAKAIFIKLGDKAKNSVIINKTDQAAFNNNIGNSPQAEVLFQEVAESCKKEFGPESPAYAAAINNLAVLYYNTGIYKPAEKYLTEAAAIYKRSPDRYQAQTAICINNLGALYHEIGNYRIAEELIKQAKSLMISTVRNESPYFSVIINNLASVSISEEYYASPENKSRERLLNSGRNLRIADSVFRLNCQKPHPFYQSIATNLAIWYNLSGDKKKSNQMLTDMAFDGNLSLRVVAMMNKMSISDHLPASSYLGSGPEPVIIPISLKLIDEVSASNMEINTTVDGDPVTNALLRMILGKATNIKKAVGIYHPAYAEVLKSLTVVYSSVDDVKREEELTLEYLSVINHRTLQDFSFLSESEKEMYYQTRLPDVHAFTAYSLNRKRTNPLITQYTYNNILLNKGLMLKSSTAMRLAILNSNDPVLLKEYDEWIALQKEISVLYATPVELRTKDLSGLESRANNLEKSLVESSQEFSDYRKGNQITWEDVRKSLKNNEAAIEFTDFKKRERDGGDAIIYCALIVRQESEYPEMIKLFSEDQLKSIINKSGANSIDDISSIYGTRNSRNEELYNLIWKPIETYLKGVQTVYMSPSGLLNKISFPAISSGKDVFLCDNYKLQIKGSTGSITGDKDFVKSNDLSAMVFGGIRYSSSNSGSDVWSYLEGTKDEGDAVSRILDEAKIKVNYLSGENATETYFKQNAGKNNILHLATHGFFFDDPEKVRVEEKKEVVEIGQVTFRGTTRAWGVTSFVNNENPLMRSGLVLAGANDVWVATEKDETDDGVLTAQEVTQIDMRKSDLVVLSACETGLGDIKGSEGVYGLQRALKMAGVKNIIMSLWEIPDRETVEFMGLFYNYLLNSKDIREAFYKSQKDMRAKYDPYFWGAFVLME